MEFSMKHINITKSGLAGGVLAVSLVLNVPAIAQSSGASTDSLPQQIEALDQKIRVIERLNEIAQEDAKAAAAKQGKVNASAGNLGVVSGDGAFSLRFSGFTQIAGRHFLEIPVTTPNHAHDFGLRRVHTDIRGTAFKNFGWRLHSNFAGNAVALLDVQLDWNLIPEFNLSAGKFKPPTGLERLLSTPRSPFIEGSFVTALQPNRDLGVQASGSIAKGVLQYQAGLFNGAQDGQDNSGDVDGNKDLYVRLFSQPFVNGSEALKGFGLGISGSTGKHEGSSPAGIATPGRQSINVYTADGTTTRRFTDTTGANFTVTTGTTTGTRSNGNLTRVSPQAYYYYGPFGVIGEYTQTTQTLVRNVNSAEVTNSAWAVTGSWILTGEKNDYRNGPKVVKSNAWPTTWGNFGAVELLVRAHGLTIDDKTFAASAYGPANNQANSIESALSGGVALGWYLNNVVKVFASYDHTTFTQAASVTVAERPDEKVLSLSFNVAY
jgi:phosphate-selective porin OprO/OprP